MRNDCTSLCRGAQGGYRGRAPHLAHITREIQAEAFLERLSQVLTPRPIAHGVIGTEGQGNEITVLADGQRDHAFAEDAANSGELTGALIGIAVDIHDQHAAERQTTTGIEIELRGGQSGRRAVTVVGVDEDDVLSWTA